MPVFDFTRSATAKEKAALETRLHRLSVPGHAEHIREIYGHLRTASGSARELAATGIRIRHGFSFGESIDGDFSDRKAPPRAERPPATRISSSRGAALRLIITAMALVQMHRKPGAKARLRDFGIEVAGSSRQLGWADLVAAPTVDSSGGRVYVTQRNKRARSVRSALESLERAGLVVIPGHAQQRNRFDDFVLLNERGAQKVGEAEEYTVPAWNESTFALPAKFVTNGWLHVLEDSEIAVLLMAACRRGGWVDDGYVAIPAEVRLRHYGIHRDPFSTARKTLEWFGLLEVVELGRRDDGRAENDERLLHRIRVADSGFDQPAVETISAVLERQISRA